MKVAVWGAGEIGTGLVYRLTSSPHVSEVLWINKTFDKIRLRVVDIQQGLAFAPTCRTVEGFPQARARRALRQCDLLVLTLGSKVPPGGKRVDTLKQNADLLTSTVIPELSEFEGIVLVVTNPVDAMTWLVHARAGIEARRCIGLGTVVETARLRASLARHLQPVRAARNVFAYAVGTHDELFVPVTSGAASRGNAGFNEEVVEMARKETANGAARVKDDHKSSLHPVVEGILAIVEAVATDRRDILTVSTRDPVDGLFYSMPCTVGRAGIDHRHAELLEDENVHNAIQKCKDELFKQRQAVEEARSDQ